mgnify:CR=1 FL=1
MTETNNVRTRYAPSPTGHLHIGGARTALFCYLFARKEQGQFVVRIEDTDQERNVANAEQGMLDGLKWLGLDWDESVDIGGPYGPYRSMNRLDTYEPYIQQLLQDGKAYYCYCTKEELDEERERQQARGEMPRYSGRCRRLSEQEIKQFQSEGRQPTVRFRVPENETIVVDDLVRGEVTFESDGIGDFVIARPDGRPMYNFAVTVDDALMKITHVVRAEEHLSNTPLQVLLYKALGFPVPRFAHASLILNKDRQKMSKRDESIIQFVDQYQKLGYLPEALVNYFALLGWAPPEPRAEDEIFSLEELIELFSLERLSKAPAVFDPEKLKWMNNHYIKQADPERIVNLCLPFLEEAGLVARKRSQEQDEWVRRLIGLYQEQLHYGAEIVELSRLFFQDDLNYNDEGKAILSEAHVRDVLETFREQLRQQEDVNPDILKQVFKATQKQTGQKGKKLFMPVRVALTGSVHGPDLRETLTLIGRDKIERRLARVLDNDSLLVSK